MDDSCLVAIFNKVKRASEHGDGNDADRKWLPALAAVRCGQKEPENWVTYTVMPWGPADLRLPDVTHSEKAGSGKVGRPPSCDGQQSTLLAGSWPRFPHQCLS